MQEKVPLMSTKNALWSAVVLLPSAVNTLLLLSVKSWHAVEVATSSYP
jgi:hypothetical protein